MIDMMLIYSGVAIVAGTLIFAKIPEKLYYNWKYKKSIVGLRKPNTKIGSWDGAIVICEYENKVICAVFQNNLDYIGTFYSWYEPIIEYNKLLNEGWQPMSNEDIQMTIGIEKN